MVQVNQVLNKARDDAGNYAQNSLPDTNNVVRMVTAGSKGSFINISQVLSSIHSPPSPPCSPCQPLPYPPPRTRPFCRRCSEVSHAVLLARGIHNSSCRLSVLSWH